MSIKMNSELEKDKSRNSAFNRFLFQIGYENRLQQILNEKAEAERQRKIDAYEEAFNAELERAKSAAQCTDRSKELFYKNNNEIRALLNSIKEVECQSEITKSNDIIIDTPSFTNDMMVIGTEELPDSVNSKKESYRKALLKQIEDNRKRKEAEMISERQNDKEMLEQLMSKIRYEDKIAEEKRVRQQEILKEAAKTALLEREAVLYLKNEEQRPSDTWLQQFYTKLAEDKCKGSTNRNNPIDSSYNRRVSELKSKESEQSELEKAAIEIYKAEQDAADNKKFLDEKLKKQLLNDELRRELNAHKRPCNYLAEKNRQARNQMLSEVKYQVPYDEFLRTQKELENKKKIEQRKDMLKLLEDRRIAKQLKKNEELEEERRIMKYYQDHQDKIANERMQILQNCKPETLLRLPKSALTKAEWNHFRRGVC